MAVPWLGNPVPSLGQGYQIIVGSTNQPVPSAKWRSRFLWPRDATICLLGQIQPLALLPFPKLCQALLLPFCQIHVLIANLLIFLSWSSLPLAFSKALAAFQKKNPACLFQSPGGLFQNQQGFNYQNFFKLQTAAETCFFGKGNTLCNLMPATNPCNFTFNNRLVIILLHHCHNGFVEPNAPQYG
jgi:hypothetical protein